MDRPSDEVVEGLKSLRGLLLVMELLFKPRLTVGAGEKALLDGEVADRLLLDQRIGAGDEGAALRRGLVSPAQGADERGVEDRNARPEEETRCRRRRTGRDAGLAVPAL